MAAPIVTCPQCKRRVGTTRKGHNYFITGHQRKKGGEWRACPGQGLQVPDPKGQAVEPADSTSGTSAAYNPDSPTSTR